MTSREQHIHSARVYITQAQTFFARKESSRSFGFTLLEWAGNQRRKAMNLSNTPPAQGSLF